MKTPEAVRAINYSPSIGNFLTMTLLSFCAIMLLPRQFHVSVVENSTDAEVGRARWLFPLYLVAINLFVIPIALAGLVTFPFGAVDPRHVRAGAADGGRSRTAQRRHLRRRPVGGDRDGDRRMRRALHHGLERPRGAAGAAATAASAAPAAPISATSCCARGGLAIFAIMVMAYFYYRALGNTQLVAIGLLSFAAIAQLAPSLLRRAVVAAGDRARRNRRHAGRLRGVALHAVHAELHGLLDFGHPAAPARAVRDRGAAAAGAVRRRPAAADAWRASGRCRSTSSPMCCCRWRGGRRSIELVQADLFVPNTLAADLPELPPLAHHRHGAGHPDHGGAISRPRPRRGIPSRRFRPGATCDSSRQRPPISSCCSTPST